MPGRRLDAGQALRQRCATFREIGMQLEAEWASGNQYSTRIPGRLLSAKRFQHICRALHYKLSEGRPAHLLNVGSRSCVLPGGRAFVWWDPMQ